MSKEISVSAVSKFNWVIYSSDLSLTVLTNMNCKGLGQNIAVAIISTIEYSITDKDFMLREYTSRESDLDQ